MRQWVLLSLAVLPLMVAGALVISSPTLPQSVSRQSSQNIKSAPQQPAPSSRQGAPPQTARQVSTGSTANHHSVRPPFPVADFLKGTRYTDSNRDEFVGILVSADQSTAVILNMNHLRQVQIPIRSLDQAANSWVKSLASEIEYLTSPIEKEIVGKTDGVDYRVVNGFERKGAPTRNLIGFISGGKAHGKLQARTKNGKLYSSHTSLNGVTHGLETVFYPNQVLRHLQFYVSGVRVWQFDYYPDGKLQQFHRAPQGKREGTCARYYRSGELLTTTEYANDQAHGKTVTYAVDGKPYEIAETVKGVVVSEKRLRNSRSDELIIQRALDDSTEEQFLQLWLRDR